MHLCQRCPAVVDVFAATLDCLAFPVQFGHGLAALISELATRRYDVLLESPTFGQQFLLDSLDIRLGDGDPRFGLVKLPRAGFDRFHGAVQRSFAIRQIGSFRRRLLSKRFEVRLDGATLLLEGLLLRHEGRVQSGHLFAARGQVSFAFAQPKARRARVGFQAGCQRVQFAFAVIQFFLPQAKVNANLFGLEFEQVGGRHFVGKGLDRRRLFARRFFRWPISGRMGASTRRLAGRFLAAGGDLPA